MLLSGCTTINIQTVDYCHDGKGGLINQDDPRCKTANPLRFENDQDSNSLRY